MLSLDLTVITPFCAESWGSLCPCFPLLLTWTLGTILFPSTGTLASQVIWVGPHEAVSSWKCRALRKWSGSQRGNPGQDGAGQLEGRAELGWAVSQTTWKVLSCEVRERELGGMPCLCLGQRWWFRLACCITFVSTGKSWWFGPGHC